jgi:hypothetical protein
MPRETCCSGSFLAVQPMQQRLLCGITAPTRRPPVVAWCETREAFRHFRTDRIRAVEPTATRYPRRRQALIREWRKAEGIEG